MENDSSQRNCMLCQEPDNLDDMVQCDTCQLWAHFCCAGVTSSIENDDWNCVKCSNTLRLPKIAGKSTKKSGGLKKAGTKSEGGSIRSSVSVLELSLQQLDEEQDAMEKGLEADRLIREKRLEMSRAIQEKRMRQEKEFREKELQQERELRATKLAQEQEILEKRLKEESEFLEKQQALREAFRAKMNLLKNTANESTSGRDEDIGNEANILKGKVQNWLNSNNLEGTSSRSLEGEHSGANKNQKEKKSELPLETTSRKLSIEKGVITSEDEDSEDGDANNEQIKMIAELLKRHGPGKGHGSGRGHVGPTKEQLAARQAVSKHLPIFKGEPEIWPLFYSSFEYTTKACGFTNLDNLKRLQDSLQGEALEAVRSRLVLPESVPDVMKDLKDLFGKPEKLLKTLLQKVRCAQPPRYDRLNTFIHFGITVKQLCDHMEAARMEEHLNNPMLVQELVDKLPPSYKIDWVRFRRNTAGTPLRVFTDFMNGIVSDVSEVSELPTLETGDRTGRGNNRKKEFVSVHASSSKNEPPVTACWLCKKADHKIKICNEFQRLNISERFKVVNKYKLCHQCLNNHGKSRCNSKFRCTVGNCQQSHHPLLHRTLEMVQVMKAENVNRENRSVLFRMLPVTLHAGSFSMNVIAFFDEGSSVTLIQNEVVDRLQLFGEKEPLVVTWTGNVRRYEDQSRKVNLMVSARGCSGRIAVHNARTVKELVLPKQGVNFQDLISRYPHLKNLPVADQECEEPKIMIGLDNLHVFAPLESRTGKPGEPVGVRCALGWTVYGPQPERCTSQAYVNVHEETPVSNQDIYDMLKGQYSLEEAGIAIKVPESNEEARARRILKTTTVRVGNRFETGLLWRNDLRKLPDSFPMAIKRMEALERKLSKNPGLKQNVDRQIDEYVNKGYAHKITVEEQKNSDAASVWYLPLNVVLNPRKPDKIRLVWDAAASVNGISLNSELLAGPDMLTSLPAVIQRFREKRFGFGGDIKEMYHQLRIRLEDKQAQRFLYRKEKGPPQTFVMDVATFGSTCSPCSAQFIKNLNAEEHSELYPDAAAAIVNKHYVDDYLDSADNPVEAIERARQVKLIHAKGGFEIGKWVSNSEEFLRALGERNDDQAVHLHQDKMTQKERVLGIIWDSKEDVFSFSATPRADIGQLFSSGDRPTKRSVLSCVMSMFDPLGLLCPFTIIGRILVQDLWRAGCEWDELIDDEAYKKWKQWIGLLPEVSAIKVPRCYFGDATSDKFGDLQLHIFTDASENAYGCAAYFRIVIDGKARCALVMSKSKVAPLKQLTIPRLELQAAVLGARLAQSIRSSHNLVVRDQYFWSDSRNVLSWIKSDQRRYRQFVGFRIGEILSLSNGSEWRWVPSKLNEADCVTKWKQGWKLHSGSSWFAGADFLLSNEQHWPVQPEVKSNTNEEVKAYLLIHDITLPNSLINVNRISKYNVVVRTMACVFRFVSNCKRITRGEPIELVKATAGQLKLIMPHTKPTKRVPLTQDELLEAETYLFKMIQAEMYGGDLKVLLHNKEKPVSQWLTVETSSPLYKLAPLIDDRGLVRMEGRTKNASFLPFDLRFPIVLPKDHPLTTKLIHHYHEKFGHGYRETVKNELKQRFYIASISRLVPKVAKDCMWCKVKRNRPVTPRMAPLPIQRLIPFQRPFSYVGVDYLGPFEVSVNRRKEKRWIVLFTCMVVRAIHLEIAHSLTTQACLMSIRRFICRRGPPLELFSDNGTNLKGASKELAGIICAINEDCGCELTTARTKWNFNPPAAPHMGGAWERLVRSTKEALAVINDGGRLTDEILLTSICEVEDMINSRPLTYVSQDADEIDTLTPNHFLRGVSPNEPLLTPPPPCAAEALRSNYHRSQQLATEMWNRWLKEYIPSVNRRTKWYGEAKPLRAGDLVYIVEGTKRKLWVRGVVQEPIVANDGRIRQAWIRTSSGVFKRATAVLAVLEIDDGNTGSTTESDPELRTGEMLRTAPRSSEHDKFGNTMRERGTGIQEENM